MPQPPEHENKALTWPNWPLKLRISSSHEEGAERQFAVLTQKFTGENGKVKKLHCVKVDAQFKPMPGSEFVIDADLVLLAMGFVHPVQEGMLKSLGIAFDPRGNAKASTNDYKTSVAEGVRRRRHAARAIAGRVGDPRRPPMRQRDRHVPDGIVDPAAVTRGRKLPEQSEEAARRAVIGRRAARAIRPAGRADRHKRLALRRDLALQDLLAGDARAARAPACAVCAAGFGCAGRAMNTGEPLGGSGSLNVRLGTRGGQE